MKKIIAFIIIFFFVSIPLAYACGGPSDFFPPYPPGWSGRSSSFSPVSPPAAYIPTTSSSSLKTLKASSVASCLKKQDVIMYGLDSCPFCKKQKKLFGSSFKEITYIECKKNSAACEEAGINQYPTWVYQGEELLGLQSLGALSEFAECNL